MTIIVNKFDTWKFLCTLELTYQNKNLDYTSSWTVQVKMYIIIVNLNTKMLADFSIKSVIAKLHNFWVVENSNLYQVS